MKRWMKSSSGFWDYLPRKSRHWRRTILRWKMGGVMMVQFAISGAALWLACWITCVLGERAYYADIADIFAPSAEEKAAAEAFFADANKSESAITDDLRAHLIAEDRIRQGDVR